MVPGHSGPLMGGRPVGGAWPTESPYAAKAPSPGSGTQRPGVGGVSRDLGAQLGPQGRGAGGCVEGEAVVCSRHLFGVLTDVSPAFCLRPLYLVQADLSSLYRLPIIYLPIYHLSSSHLSITYLLSICLSMTTNEDGLPPGLCLPP